MHLVKNKKPIFKIFAILFVAIFLMVPVLNGYFANAQSAEEIECNKRGGIWAEADGCIPADSKFGGLKNIPESPVQPDPNQVVMDKTAKEAGVLAQLMGRVLGGIVSLAAGLIDFTISLSSEITSLNGVQIGWKVFLNLANLGFVLALIVMAFATILHYESYAMKKSLLNLIVAALLVNFSLVITGSVIDISNKVSEFFIKPLRGENGNENFVSDAMANALAIQNVGAMSAVENDTGKMAEILSFLKDSTSWLFSAFASIAFTIIFTLFTALVFGTLAVMLVVRLIYLMILSIVSPIAWLAYIFPSTKSYYKKWWDELIRWNLFLPAALFFVYLSIVIAQGMSNVSAFKNATDIPAIHGIGTSLPTGVGFFQHALKLIMVLGFLVGGMIVSNSFSKKGSQFAIGRATKFSNGVKESTKKWASSRSRGVAWRASQSATGSERVKKWTKTLADSKMPFTGTLAKGINRLGARVDKGVSGINKEQYKDYQAYLKGLSKERLETELATVGIADGIGMKKNIALEWAAKNGKLPMGEINKLVTDSGKLEKVEKDFDRQGLDKKVIHAATLNNSEILKLNEEVSGKQVSLKRILKEILENEAKGNLDAAEAGRDQLSQAYKEMGEMDRELVKKRQDFMEKMDQKDFTNSVLVRELFKDDPKIDISDKSIGVMRKTMLEAMARAGHAGAMHKMFPKMSAAAIDNFIEVMKAVNKTLPKNIQTSVNKAMKNSLGKRFAGEVSEDKKEEEKEEKKEDKKEDKK